MYKNLSIILLLAAFGLVAARSTGTPVATLTSPTIVATLALPHQIATIPTTTMFTPKTSGLYRISVYMTQVVSTSSTETLWRFNLNWTDSAGAETSLTDPALMSLNSTAIPPFAWANTGLPGAVAVIEAVKGQPVTYSVTQDNFQAGGEYFLAFVVEQLS